MFNKHIYILLPIFLFSLCPVKTFSQNWKKLQEEAQTKSNGAQYPEALELCNKAIKEIEKDKKATRNDKLALNSDLGAYLVGTDKVGEGLKILMDVIEEIEKNPVSPNSEIHIRSGYGTVLMTLGYNNDALTQFQKIYDIIKSGNYDKTEMDKSDIVYNIGCLGQCYHKQYKFDKAEALYNESISYCEKEKLTGTTDYPFQFTLLASLYVDMFFETRALNAYEKAESAYQKNKDTLSPEYSIFLLNYGTLMTNMSKFDQALAKLTASKILTKKIYGEKSNDYAIVLNNIGYTYSKMNKLTETEQYYLQSVNIKKSLSNIRIENYLNGINNLMVFCDSYGRTDEGNAFCKELETGLLNKNLEDTLTRATFAYNIAAHYRDTKNIANAVKFYKEALIYYQHVYGGDNNEFCTGIYTSLAQLKMQENKYDEANSYLLKCAQTFTNSTNNTPEGSVTTLINLALILHSANEYKSAQTAVDQALEIAKSTTLKEKWLYEQLYLSKANNAGGNHQPEVAMEYFGKYLELMYSKIDQNFAFMTEEEKIQFLQSFESNVESFYTTITEYIKTHPEYVKVLLNFRIKIKGLLLNNLSKIKQKVIELNDPALNEKFEKLRSDRENIIKLMNLNTDEYPQALAEVGALKTEADVLEKEISAKVSTVIEKQNLYWKSIQKLLQPNEAAIEVLQTEFNNTKDERLTSYAFLIIKNTGDPIAVTLDRPLTWENEMLTQYRNSINSKKIDPNLYERLWMYLPEKLAGITSIYFSPDGIYNEINLNTLYNGITKKYLIEELNVHYVTSLKDIINIKQFQAKKPQNVTLVGNPNFDYDLSKLPQNKQDFGDALAVRGAMGFVLPELPGTKTEVETIKNHLIKNGVSVQLLSEEKANEAEVKKIKNPDVLHLATHGFFLEDYPEESLSQLTKTEQAFYKNPMMRSGIFFSGSNKTYSINTSSAGHLKDFEDGMLTAYEAMNLNLDQTELVVLSACQTGLGKVKNGEGVFGLQRAFKLAGAKSIIMSYWPVSDDATMELMTNFYNSWTATGDIYTAFKVAQMAVKQKYPEPYYWGAFVLNGR